MIILPFVKVFFILMLLMLLLLYALISFAMRRAGGATSLPAPLLWRYILVADIVFIVLTIVFILLT